MSVILNNSNRIANRDDHWNHLLWKHTHVKLAFIDVIAKSLQPKQISTKQINKSTQWEKILLKELKK